MKAIHAYQLTTRQIAAMKKAKIRLPLALRLRDLATAPVVTDNHDNRTATAV